MNLNMTQQNFMDNEIASLGFLMLHCVHTIDNKAKHSEVVLISPNHWF